MFVPSLLLILGISGDDLIQCPLAINAAKEHMKGHQKPKPRLRWTLPRGWHRVELEESEMGNWETENGENAVVVRKEGKLVVVETSDYMREYIHRIQYFESQAALDGAYEEMWGRSPDWH